MVQQILIVGGGTAGWMCAAACAAKLDPRTHRVRLVESDEIGTVGVGEATLPQMKDFNDVLGIDEVAFMKATQATFKLGIEFVDWGRAGTRYIHPFGTFGRPIGGADFFAYWARARRDGAARPLFDYCFPIKAAEQNRFMRPNGDPADVRNAFAYAYHLDATLYARFLRGWAEARGIERVEGRIVDVERRGDGQVAAVRLASGERLAADLFVDCSGFRSLLLGQTLGVGLEDWSGWLPCDRAVAVPCVRADGPLLPYTRATRARAGWRWRIGLQHRTGNGYVYSSRDISDDAAAAELLSGLDAEPLAEPRVLRFTAGKRRAAWAGNVVGVGLAGGFLEPLESTSIYLVQMAAMQLVTLLPASPAIDPALPAEFNRVMDVEYDRIRDFLILHYIANEADAPLWERVTTMPLPDSLADKIARFRHRAHVPGYRDGLFGPPSWQAVFVGQGVEPQGHDRLADAMPAAQLKARLDALAAAIRDGVATAPRHDAFVAADCPAPTR